MNYQCQNPACDLTGEGVSEKIAKRRNHKCEACGSVLVPVVDSGASSAASRDSAELSALVADLPTMLALPLAEYLEETHPALKLWGLCDFTELSLRLLVIMGIADHRGHLPPSLVTAVKEVIDRPSLGQWLGITRAILKDRPVSTIIPELDKAVAALSEILGKSKDKAESKALPLRNLLAHGGGLRKNQAAELWALWEPRMRDIVAAVTWTKAVDILGRDRDGTLKLMKGQIPTAMQGHTVPAEPAEALWLRRGDAMLELWPLGRFAATDSDETSVSASVPQLYCRNGEIGLQYSTFGGIHPVSESGNHTRLSFEQLFKMDDCPPQRESCSVKGFDDETRKDAARLIGRTTELEQLLRAVQAMQGGLLWLGGPAGMGKSCLMAALARDLLDSPPERTLILVYRFRTSDDRCSRDSFCRFAIERLEGWDGLQPAEKDLSETATVMERLRHCVKRISDDHYVAFVLDGLDEIAERDPLFHQEIPIALASRRLSVVCAGRPECNLPEAFHKAGAVEPFVDGLPPMTPDDVRAMLMDLTDAPLRKRLAKRDQDTPDRVANPFIDRVCALAEGLPLYVRYAVGDILKGKLAPESEGQLPAGLHKYHEELLRRCEISDLQAVLTPLVVFLALTYEPLTVDQLATLLVRRKLLVQPDADKVTRALGGVSSMIRRTLTPDGQAGFTVYHHSLSQYIIQRPEFDTVALTRTALADAALSPAGDLTAHYLYRCGIRHLLDDGKAAEAITLLTNFDYVMARFMVLGSGKEAVAGYYQDWNLVRAAGALTGEPAIWWDFLRSHWHLIMRADHTWGAHKILLQLAVEHADDSPVTKAAEAWLENNNNPKWIWLKQMNRPKRRLDNGVCVGLDGHAEFVEGLELRDGRVLSWSWDNRIRIWSNEGMLINTITVHAESEYRQQFINTVLELQDGRILTLSGANCVCGNNTLRLWGQDGKALVAAVEGCEEAIELLDGRIVTWATEHTPKPEFEKWSDEDGNRLIAEQHVSNMEELLEKLGAEYFYNLIPIVQIRDSNGNSIKTLYGHTSAVRGVLEFNQGVLFTWSGDSLRMWDDQWNCIREVEGNICFAIKLRDNRIAVSGCFNNRTGVQLFDCDGDSVWFSKKLINPPYILALNGGGLSLWGDNEIDLWTGNKNARSRRISHAGVTGVTELRSGNILSWGRDGAIRLWDKTGHAICAMEQGVMENAGAFELNDGNILSWSGCVLHLWGEDGRYVSALGSHSGYVKHAQELRNGKILTWSDTDIRIWDRVIKNTQDSAVPDDKISGVIKLTSGGFFSWNEYSIRKMDVCGYLAQKLDHDGRHGKVFGALELNDGKTLTWSWSGICSGIRNDYVEIWSRDGDLSNRQDLTVEAAVRIGNGRILLRTRRPGDVPYEVLQLYDSDFTLIKEFDMGGDDSIAVGLSDGSFLGSCGNTIFSWDQDGLPLGTLVGHADNVLGAIELRDGRILSWAADHTLRLWDKSAAFCKASADGTKVVPPLSKTGRFHNVLKGRTPSRPFLSDFCGRLIGKSNCVMTGHKEGIDGACETFDGRILSWGTNEIRIWKSDGSFIEEVADRAAYASAVTDEWATEWFYDRLKSDMKLPHFGPWLLGNGLLGIYFNYFRNLQFYWHQTGEVAPLLLDGGGVAVFAMGNRPAFTHLMWGRSPVSLSQAQGIALSQSESLRQYRMAADTSPDGASCYSITPRLARNEKLSDAQEKMVKLLDCYLRQTIPITDELIVYRGCSANELAELPGNAYPSFLSASTKIDEAFKFMRGCLVRIICPVGTKMLQVSPVQTECASLEHDEILLPRNIRLRKEKWNLVLTDTQLVLLQAKQINQFETWTLTNNRR